MGKSGLQKPSRRLPAVGLQQRLNQPRAVGVGLKDGQVDQRQSGRIGLAGDQSDR